MIKYSRDAADPISIRTQNAPKDQTDQPPQGFTFLEPD
jgi:hypothetical protein